MADVHSVECATVVHRGGWPDPTCDCGWPARLDGVRSEAARQLADIRGRTILAGVAVAGRSLAYRAADAAEAQWRRDNPWMSELIGPEKFPVTNVQIPVDAPEFPA